MACYTNVEPVDDRRRRAGRTGTGRQVAGSLLIGVCLMAGGGVAIGAGADPAVSTVKWDGGQESRFLDDGAELSEYVTRTDALTSPDASMHVRFVPRFDCSPLLGFALKGEIAAQSGDGLEDGVRVTLSIDGATRDLTVFVDRDEDGVALWTDDASDSRSDLRGLIDAGSFAELGLPDAEDVGFSLIGSRRSLAAMEAACRQHQPLDQAGS